MNATDPATRSSEETYLSYVSPLLLRRLQNPAPILPPDVERTKGAVALIDVEKFSTFAERMSSRGSEGVELLANRINDTFALVVESIERYGGIAHSFPGDSVIALWTADDRTAEEATLLATRCALELLDSHRDSELPLKAGLAFGELSIAHVGGIGGRLQLLLSGAPLDLMGRAEEHSSRGRLIASESAWRLLAPHAIAAVESEGFFEVKSLRSAPPPSSSNRESPPWQLGTVEAARAYLPSALLRQLDAGQSQWLGEFREITTLFIQIRTADAAGSDTFSLVQEAFRAVQSALYRYGGDVTRFAHDDKGMAVLSVFGLPPGSTEDGAARAVQAALQIEADAPKFRFRCRVGVATGRVFCGTLGAPGRREFSVVGSTPNLAARLMQSLESGVLCDVATMRAAGPAFRFDSAGRLKPKGFPDPIEVYRPKSSGKSPAQAQPHTHPTVMIGRDNEIARLHAWIDELRRRLAEHRGGELAADSTVDSFADEGVARAYGGCLAVVQGEAGIGKSTLIREACDNAARNGLEVVRVACEAVQSTSTYASWAKVIVRLLRLDESTSPVEAAARVLRSLSASGVPAEMAPLVAPILEVPIEENETTREMSGTARSDNLLALLTRLVSHLAVETRQASGGLLLVLEDVHWLDPASWELLGVVTRTLDTRTLGVLATLRSEATPTTASWHGVVMAPETERISLSALTRSETKELAQRLLHAPDISSQLLQITFDRTRGNPFFCEQLLRALSESGIAGIEDGVARLRVRNPEQAESLVPRSVAAVVTSRLDRLPASVQLTLKAASVIGARFRMDVLRAIHPMRLDEATLGEHLADAIELGLVEEAREDPGSRCFQHAITCDVAYGLLLVSQRKQLHREVAEFLGSESDSPAAQAVLFYHWRRSGDEGRALQHVDHAGAEAMRTGDYHAVTELYGYALQTLASQPELATPASANAAVPREALWSGHLGEAQVAIGLHEVAKSNLEMSLEVLGEKTRANSVALVRGIVRETLRQLVHRIAPGRFQGRRAADAQRLAYVVGTYEQLAFVYYSSGETLPGLYTGLRILNLAELAGIPGLMAKSYAVMTLTASFIAGARLAAVYDRFAVELARETGDPAITAYVGWVTALRNAGEARWGLAEMRIEAAVKTAEQIGDRRLMLMALTVLAWPPYVRGEFDRVLEVAERQLAMARESNNRLWEAWGLNGVAEPAAMLGDHETVIRCCQRALAILSEESDRAEEIRALGLLAFSSYRLGRADEAYATARRALDQASSGEITSFIASEGLAAICEVMLGLSEEAQARSSSVPSTLRRDSKRSVKALARFSKSFLLGRPRAHIANARLAMVEGSPAIAVAELDRALRCADEYGMSHAKGLALLASAQCRALDADSRRRRAEEAVSVLRSGEALKVARELTMSSPR